MLARSSVQTRFAFLLHLNSAEVYILQYSFYDLLRRRRYNPNIACTQGDVLHTWKLHKLEIWEWTYKDRDTVRAVADAIPALARAMEDDNHAH